MKKLLWPITKLPLVEEKCGPVFNYETGSNRPSKIYVRVPREHDDNKQADAQKLRNVSALRYKA